DRIGFDKGMYVGYTSIVLSLMLVFFGIRSYRDNVAGGHISFGKGFQVGILITLISCAFYIISWEILYYTVYHDFMDKYAAHMIAEARLSGATEAALQKQMAEAAEFKQAYENPLVNAAYTFMEPFPVGLVITTVSAAILKRKKGAGLREANAV
ncbi:MAG TPA: DUF4199 domain-containing protein, partial [Terriglobales bacterium]|nr:DUF4199 domain-containing protein [Terriglobales bacterium]